MPDLVELRSDTFTKPTPEMRRAMADAEVGDDVWGEDPTANALQEQCAALFGKEAGLFVPSGSMGNEAAIKALTNPGEEIIVEASSHIIEAEVGAPATISQVLVRALHGPRGVFDLEELSGAIKLPSRFFTHTSVVCIENTHQASGGGARLGRARWMRLRSRRTSSPSTRGTTMPRRPPARSRSTACWSVRWARAGSAW